MLTKRIIPCLDVKYGEGNRALVAKGTIYVPSMIAVSKDVVQPAAVRIYESITQNHSLVHYEPVKEHDLTKILSRVLEDA